MPSSATNEKRTSVCGLGEIAFRVNNLDAMQRFFEDSPATVRYCGTDTTLTPFISSFCRTSGEVTAASGTASLPPDRLIDRLYWVSFSGPSICAMCAVEALRAYIYILWNC